MALRSATLWRCLVLLCCFVAACSAVRISSGSSWDGDAVVARAWPSRWLPRIAYLRGEAEDEGCEEGYGFLPCSTSILGNLFLLIVYGYLLLKAAGSLSEGSELLLTVVNPGIIGGLLLPILGALPDALLILVSGLSASAEAAQSQVLVGMGLLAGSNVMLLTALWGGSLLLGRCDLVTLANGRQVAVERQLTKGWSLTETGVTTDQQTRVASWIMIVTVLPYLVAQTPVVFGWSSSTGSTFVLVACAISFVGLVSYCTYQVSFPWVQQQKIFRAKQNLQRSRALHGLSKFSAEKSWGPLVTGEHKERKPNKAVLQSLFEHFDIEKDGTLSMKELEGLVIGLGIQNGLPTREEVQEWMTEFDRDDNGNLSEAEFVNGMCKWIEGLLSQEIQAKKPARSRQGNGIGVSRRHSSNGLEEGPHLFWRYHQDNAETNLDALLQEAGDEEEEETDEQSSRGHVIFLAVCYLILGALIAGVVADPLVDSIGNFSTATGISPFFISFVATPLASNSSEAISSLLFAMKKKKKNISMTYSQIYGGVTMNNTMCLAIFLAIVYTRGLTWDFSSEVLIILLATIVIGALASLRVTFPSWLAWVSLLLYPSYIALVAVLDYVFGWQ